MVVLSSIPRFCFRRLALFWLFGKLSPKDLILSIKCLLFIFYPRQVLRHLVKLLLCLFLTPIRLELGIIARNNVIMLHLAYKALERTLLISIKPIKLVYFLIPYSV